MSDNNTPLIEVKNLKKHFPVKKSLFGKHDKVVKAVDKTFFSGFGHGFETDRGRVFLKYGKPNFINSTEWPIFL